MLWLCGRWQGGLAAIGAISGLLVCAFGASFSLLTLIAAVLMLAMWPYTVVAMFPTNYAILGAINTKSEEKVPALYAKWGNLHLVRTVLSTVAFALLLLR